MRSVIFINCGTFGRVKEEAQDLWVKTIIRFLKSREVSVVIAESLDHARSLLREPPQAVVFRTRGMAQEARGIKFQHPALRVVVCSGDPPKAAARDTLVWVDKASPPNKIVGLILGSE